jgi:hypothetical protein
MYQLIPIGSPTAAPIPPIGSCAVVQDQNTGKVLLLFSDASTVELGAATGDSGNPKSSTFATTSVAQHTEDVLVLPGLPAKRTTYTLRILLGYAVAAAAGNGCIIDAVLDCNPTTGFAIVTGPAISMPLEDPYAATIVVTATKIQLLVTGAANFTWGWTLSYSKVVVP